MALHHARTVILAWFTALLVAPLLARAAEPAPASAAEWAVRLFAALNRGDAAAAKKFLHLDEDLAVEPRPAAKLRREWLASIGEIPAAAGAEVIVVCTEEQKREEVAIGGRERKVDFEERVTAIFRQKGDACFQLVVHDVLRHPAVGWVGITPDVSRAQVECPSDRALQAPVANDAECKPVRFEQGVLSIGR